MPLPTESAIHPQKCEGGPTSLASHELSSLDRRDWKKSEKDATFSFLTTMAPNNCNLVLCLAHGSALSGHAAKSAAAPPAGAGRPSAQNPEAQQRPPAPIHRVSLAPAVPAHLSCPFHIFKGDHHGNYTASSAGAFAAYHRTAERQQAFGDRTVAIGPCGYR